MQGLRGRLHLRAPTEERMQGLRGRLHLRAHPTEKQVQGLRGRVHLRAQPSEERMQGLRGRLHLRAQPSEERMQGLRGRLHLRAQPSEEQVRGLRGRLHLRPPPRQERMQGLQAGSCDRMLGVHAHAPYDPSRTSARGLLVTHLQTTKPHKYSQTRSQTLARERARTHTHKRAHTHHAYGYALGATAVFSSADDNQTHTPPVTRRAATRGWCPLSLSAASSFPHSPTYSYTWPSTLPATYILLRHQLRIPSFFTRSSRSPGLLIFSLSRSLAFSLFRPFAV
jgi:hypothetical protein